MQQENEYRQRSKAFLKKAGEELAAGDLEQASEKAWGAAALIVKAVADRRGIPHTSHNGLWRIVEDLGAETGDDELVDLFGFASNLHKNFYENRMRARTVERGINQMSGLSQRLKYCSRNLWDGSTPRQQSPRNASDMQQATDYRERSKAFLEKSGEE